MAYATDGTTATVTPLEGWDPNFGYSLATGKHKSEEVDEEDDVAVDDGASPRESEASGSTHTAWSDENANPANAGVA